MNSIAMVAGVWRFGFAFLTSIVTLGILAGCTNASGFWIILATDAGGYRPQMTWDEVRESEYKKPYTLRVFDSIERPVQLFRFSHGTGNVMPLDDSLLHISTPIIVKREHRVLVLAVFDQTNEVQKIRVDTRQLKPLAGERNRYVLPLALPHSRP